MTDPKAIARGLSEAQRRAVIAEGYGAGWPTIEALRDRRIFAVRVCFPDSKGISLTPLGLAVRDELRKLLQDTPKKGT